MQIKENKKRVFFSVLKTLLTINENVCTVVCINIRQRVNSFKREDIVKKNSFIVIQYNNIWNKVTDFFPFFLKL